MVKILKSMTAMALLSLPLCGSQAAETTEVPEAMVVVGRQPGPPLLEINELLSATGLLSQLKAKGYEVREP